MPDPVRREAIRGHRRRMRETAGVRSDTAAPLRISREMPEILTIQFETNTIPSRTFCEDWPDLASACDSPGPGF